MTKTLNSLTGNCLLKVSNKIKQRKRCAQTRPNLKKLEQGQILAKKGTFFKKGYQKFHQLLFNTFSNCFASK